MYKTIEQEYDSGKRGPGATRIVSCEYLGRGVTAIEHFSIFHYTLYYRDGKTEVVSGDKAVVHLAAELSLEPTEYGGSTSR